MVKRMNRYNEILDWLQNEHNEVFNQWAQIEEVLRLEEEQERAQNISRDNKMFNYCISRYKETYPNTSPHILDVIDMINDSVNWCYEDKMMAIRPLLHERGGRIFRGSGNLWGQWKSEFKALEEEE